ncbi:hypothetical protein RUND412_000333 [Rhizina undulata]
MTQNTRGSVAIRKICLAPHIRASRPSGAEVGFHAPKPQVGLDCETTGNSAIYDSQDESDRAVAYGDVRGTNRYAYPARGRSGSVVMVMPRTRQEELDSAADTAYWGWVVFGVTWIVFVVGMGSVLGVWEWAWDVGESPFPDSTVYNDDEGAFPIPGYYPALMILTCIMAWVWVVAAWVGMKYFKHAKIQPPSLEDT